MEKDDIEFPPLPGVFAWAMVDEELAEAVQEYVRAAIESDRQRRSEPVGYVHPANEHRLYSGETVAFRQRPYDGEKKIPVYLSPQPTEEVFCEECGDGLVVEDPGICVTCYQTKYVSPQTADPVDDCPKGDKWNCKYCRRLNYCPVKHLRDAHNGDPVKSPIDGLMNALRNQRQIDSDGTEVGVSRQALDEAIALLSQYGHTAEPVKKHPDDEAVDGLAVAMKTKLAKKRSEGRGGWQTMSASELSALLHEHVAKGDPLDVANIAMMLLQNGQRIEPVKVPSDAELDAIIHSVQHNGRASDDIRYVRDVCRALFARYGHNYQPRYKDSDDFHANATLPELDAWQRGWDDCNTGIEAESLQLVPKVPNHEMIKALWETITEKHETTDGGYADMLKAAPKFGEKE